MTDRDKDGGAAIELLQKVMRYRRGEGEYNFSGKPDDQRENYAFDAWCLIENEIDALLKSRTTGDGK